jgi:alcohol dehydrogenase class IV
MGLPGQDYQAVLNWILDLRQELGLPASLGELGIKQAHIPTIVESALTDVNLSTNPIPVSGAQLEKLLLKAVQGRL